MRVARFPAESYVLECGRRIRAHLLGNVSKTVVLIAGDVTPRVRANRCQIVVRVVGELSDPVGRVGDPLEPIELIELVCRRPAERSVDGRLIAIAVITPNTVVTAGVPAAPDVLPQPIRAVESTASGAESTPEGSYVSSVCAVAHQIERVLILFCALSSIRISLFALS